MRCNTCGADVTPKRSDCDRCFTPVGAPAVLPGVRTYRLGGIAMAATVLIGLTILVDLVLAFWQPVVGQLMAQRAGRELSIEPISVAVAGEGLLTLVYLAFFVAAGVLVIVWTYRARVNLEAFPGAIPGMARAWAIWGWLVPFVHLVVPVRVLGTIARASLAKLVTPTIVWVWYVAWLVYFVGDRFTARASERGLDELPYPVAASDFQRYADHFAGTLAPNLIVWVAGIVAGGALVMLMHQVSRAQEKRMAPRWPTGAEVTPGMTVPPSVPAAG